MRVKGAASKSRNHAQKAFSPGKTTTVGEQRIVSEYCADAGQQGASEAWRIR